MRATLATMLAVLALTYVAGVGIAVAQSAADGAWPALAVFASFPTSLEDLIPLPLIGGVLLIEIASTGWRASVLRRLVRGEATRSDRADLFYLLGNCTGLLTIVALVLSFGLAGGLERLLGHAGIFHVADTLPLPVQMAMIYVLGDFGEYWMHRLMHSRLMWPLHAVHHAAENVSVLSTTRHHPLDGIVSDFPYLVLGALLGFSPQATLYATLLGGLHAFYIHSSLPCPTWIERFLFTGPRLHLLHHSIEKRHHDRNFGMIVLWDHLFGTHHLDTECVVRTGVTDPRYDTGRPTRDMLDVALFWARGIGAGLRLRRPRATALAPMLVLAFGAASAMAAPPLPPPPALLGLGVAGGDFRAALSDGRVLTGHDLVGATLDIGTSAQNLALRIDSAEADAHPQSADVWLFGMTVVQPGVPERPFCEPDPDGRQLAMPYPAPGGFALTCTSGAFGKCMRFGYRPWAHAPDGTDLAVLHAACVRMVRADYGGDDRPWTRNGMRIDVYDDHGIEAPESDMPFEAGWSPEGAVCVAHVRVPENGALADVAKAEPRLAGRVGPEVCTEESARALGAVMFNRSAAR